MGDAQGAAAKGPPHPPCANLRIFAFVVTRARAAFRRRARPVFGAAAAAGTHTLAMPSQHAESIAALAASVHGRRAAVGLAATALFCGGWMARRHLVRVHDHTFNWRMANAIATRRPGEATADQYTPGYWMHGWNSSCHAKFGGFSEPREAELELGEHRGSCDGWKKQPELTRAPISALTSFAFLSVSAVAVAEDPVLALGSAAVAAGSYAWHSTGMNDGPILDHYGCTIFAAAVAATLVRGSGAVPAPAAAALACFLLAAIASFTEARRASEYGAYTVAVAAVAALALCLGRKPWGFLNCAAAGAVGIALHERADDLNARAACSGSLGDDLEADAVHSAWHCCAVVLGLEALLFARNSPSPLSAAALGIAGVYGIPEAAPYGVPSALAVAAAVCVFFAYIEHRSRAGGQPGPAYVPLNLGALLGKPG